MYLILSWGKICWAECSKNVAKIQMLGKQFERVCKTYIIIGFFYPHIGRLNFTTRTIPLWSKI